MKQKPLEWLLSAVEMINANQKSHPFKVVRIDPNGCKILVRDTGAVWSFVASVEREEVA